MLEYWESMIIGPDAVILPAVPTFIWPAWVVVPFRSTPRLTAVSAASIDRLVRLGADELNRVVVEIADETLTSSALRTICPAAPYEPPKNRKNAGSRSTPSVAPPIVPSAACHGVPIEICDPAGSSCTSSRWVGITDDANAVNDRDFVDPTAEWT